MAMFGIALVFAGIILFIIGVCLAVQNRSFRNALPVTGTVIRKHSRKMKNNRAYLLLLSYSVEGTEYEREVGVFEDEYDNIEIGDHYEVVYRPDKPKKILRERDLNPKFVKVFLILGASLFVAGAAILVIIRLVNM